jgi:alpha-tubulin suppressor-like RCC1 family protein
MPGKFLSPDGDLETMFVDDYAMIDEFAATGSLWGWGLNSFGQIGDNSSTPTSSPVQTISGGTNWKLVSAGGYHSTVIKTDGTLWTWGRNPEGQLGDNSVTLRSSPVQTVAGGTNWKSVSGGISHTAAIKTDGTLWLWGINSSGTLGDNTSTRRSSPVQTVAGGNNWKSVVCGGNHTATIKTDGTLWLWGNTLYGRLGNNSAAAGSISSPVQTVAGGTNWKLVSAGLYYTAAIKTDNSLWLWGRNNYGELGINALGNRSSPVQTVSGGTNWKQVSCGGIHTAAIKTNGTLWMWGRNTLAQLGDTTLTNKSSPVQTAAGGTNWKLVSGGRYYTSAIKTDGTLWMWGRNLNGQLGDNTSANKLSPVQTVAGGNNWKSVSGGGGHTAAIHFYDAGNLYPSA